MGYGNLRDELGRWSSSKYAKFNDGLISFDFPHHLDRDKTLFFERWDRETGGNRGGNPKKLPVKDVWDENGLHVRANNWQPYRTGSIVSRLTKKYPVFSMQVTLPTLSNDRRWQFCLETGHQATAGEASFWNLDTPTEAHFRMYNRGIGSTELNVTSLLPGDFDTADNVYRMRRYAGGAWLTINSEIKAVLLDGVPGGIPTWENSPPYALGSVTDNLSSELGYKMQAFSNTDTEWTFPLTTTDRHFGMFQGQPYPPRQFPLYNENTSTQWQGLNTGGAVQTSHPIPIWGYENKVLQFQSDSGGTLEIQLYLGGGWRTYYEKTVTANELFTYSLGEGEAPIARCVYTPTNSDIITLGEWYLS